jgi:hypothetical protein
MDQSMASILKYMALDQLQLSYNFKNNYAEQYDEIDVLFKSITDIDAIQCGKLHFDASIQLGERPTLKLTVNGNDFFETFKKMNRFSSVEVKVVGTITPPPEDYPKKHLNIESLELNDYDQSNLDNDLSYPKLKKFGIRNARLTDYKVE